ncbi:MAG: hypothetical protein ABF379_05775 [Akkermansiaceae bacterium]
MKKLLLAPVLLLITSFPTLADDNQPKKERPSILTFSDKSRISGTPKSVVTENKQLILDSSSLKGLTTLNTGKLLEMTLNGTPKKVEAEHYALATIKGHFRDSHRDTIRGRLTDLDDESITLETWYAGKLTLRRSLVHSLDIFNQSPSFYNGPEGPKGWVSAGGDINKYWSFKNRTMVSKARSGIAREVEIPEKSKISFTANWKSSPYFRILFFSDDGSDDYPGTGYSLNVQRTYMSVYRNAPNDRNNDIISESIRNLLEAETAEFTIYLDRSKDGTNAIYIDDKEIGTWTGVDDTKFEGKWIHFVPQNTSPIKFSNISVAQWDGTLPAKPEAEGEDDGAKEELEGQEIRLANGDVIIGSVKSITKGQVDLATSFGDVGVPIKLMRSVALSEKVDEVRMETNDVRCWFHEGGYITVKLKSLDQKNLKGYSQVWGDAVFDINAFSRIEFNIWRPELDTARYGSTTDW